MRKLSSDAEKIMIERFGKDTVIALATVEQEMPYVRNVNWCYVKITDTLNLYFLGKSAKCTKWSHLFHGLLDNEPLMA